MKLTSVFILILFQSITLAQDLSQKLVYTISNGEKIIIKDEHGLLISNNKSHHILFLEKDSMKYIVYDEKKYGPFEEIKETESEANLLDWAVKKNGKWFQLFLDFDKLIGPFDEVIDVYRSNEGGHFGFRARSGTEWFVIIDDEKFGPYSDLYYHYPRFSNNGNNWIFEYSLFKNGKYEQFFKSKNEDFKVPKSDYIINNIDVCDDRLNYFAQKGGEHSIYFTTRYKSDVHLGNNDGVRYFFKSKSQVKEANKMFDFYSESKIIDLIKDNKSYYVLYTDEISLKDKDGNSMGPYNDVVQIGSEKCITYAVIKNYFVKQKGKFIPIYTNFENENIKINELPNGEFKNEVKIIVGKKEYGPFNSYKSYSLQIGNKNNFICVVNEDNELFSNGELTGIKNIDYVKYDETKGNYIAYTKDKEVWYNKKNIGKFNINSMWSDIKFSTNGKDFAIIHKKDNNKYYVYLSSENTSIGPLKVEDTNFEWVISDDFKNFIYNNGIVYDQNNKILDEGGFSLQYSKETNSFDWLNLKGNQIFKIEYKNK